MEKVTVRYKGASPMGTLTPRRMWRPGDKLTVDPDVAEELLKEAGFVKVRVRKSRKKATKPKTPDKDDPPQGKDDSPDGEPKEVNESASTQPPEE